MSYRVCTAHMPTMADISNMHAGMHKAGNILDRGIATFDATVRQHYYTIEEVFNLIEEDRIASILFAKGNSRNTLVQTQLQFRNLIQMLGLWKELSRLSSDRSRLGECALRAANSLTSVRIDAEKLYDAVVVLDAVRRHPGFGDEHLAQLRSVSPRDIDDPDQTLICFDSHQTPDEDGYQVVTRRARRKPDFNRDIWNIVGDDVCHYDRMMDWVCAVEESAETTKAAMALAARNHLPPPPPVNTSWRGTNLARDEVDDGSFQGVPSW